MEKGDIARVEVEIYKTIEVREYELDLFHGCLGYFATSNDRAASRFTPLCSLLTPVEGSYSYISNYGEICTEYNRAYEVIKRESYPDFVQQDYD